MSTSTNINIRIDQDVKNRCEAVFNSLGLNLTAAFNVFARKSIEVGGFPFDVRLDPQPNKETLLAMLEAERIAHDPTVKRYHSVEDALKALKE